MSRSTAHGVRVVLPTDYTGRARERRSSLATYLFGVQCNGEPAVAECTWSTRAGDSTAADVVVITR